MICPRCGQHNPRFSEICTDCGADTRILKSAPPVQTLGFVDNTHLSKPISSLQKQELYSATTHAVACDVSLPGQTPVDGQPLQAINHPHTVDALIVALVAGAFVVGFVAGRVMSLVSAAPPPPAVVSLPAVVTSSQPIQVAETVPTSIPTLSDSASVQTFRPALNTRATSITPPITKPLVTPSLKLLNSFPVPMKVRSQIDPAYHDWEISHAEDARETQHFISLYAPDAEINYRPQQRISIEKMRLLAIEARNAGMYTRVSDIAPIRWAQNSVGDQVEMVLYHRYDHDGDGWTSGERRLIWEKRAGKWQIARDDFPTSCMPAVQSGPAP